MTDYTKHRFHVLDGMRGVAAIMVMIYHYYMHLYLRCLKNPFLAVDFFFILSGFVIFHAYGEKILKGMPASEYIGRRIGRLYPLLAVGILLGIPALYMNTVSTAGDYTRRDIASTLASNLAMLPYLATKKLVVDNTIHDVNLFPSDNPLWSIFFELIASVVFLALLRLRELQLKLFCIFWFSALVIASFFHGFATYRRLSDMDMGWGTDNFLGGFPRIFYGFSMGMLIYRWRFEAVAPRLIERIKLPINPWILYGLLVAVLAFPSNMQGAYDLFAVAALAPLLVRLGSLSICRNLITTKVSEFLGWLSFPVYCLHIPIWDGVMALDRHLNFSSIIGVSTEVAAIVVTFILSIIIGVVIDRMGVQRKLANLLGRGFAVLAR
jgi:peptidoglycan/LPS O-acetylase OafA/YrhL